VGREEKDSTLCKYGFGAGVVSNGSPCLSERACLDWAGLDEISRGMEFVLKEEHLQLLNSVRVFLTLSDVLHIELWHH
jgi:hypothetical protein